MVSSIRWWFGPMWSCVPAVLGLAMVASFADIQLVRAQDMTAKQEPIPDAVWAKMQGRSWKPALKCPARADLVLLTVPYLDFDGQPKLGPLIVAKTVADEVAAAFTDIFESGTFRIERMELIDDDKYKADDDLSMAANNTSAFNCRLKTNGKTLSAHSFGTAIDINPVQNPYKTNTRTLPEAGKAYDEPKERKPEVTGIILEGDAVTKAFAKQGWIWGGNWTSSKDYQHFSKDGS